MAYQISLTLNGQVLSSQFESFSFTDMVDITEKDIATKGGPHAITHVPGTQHVSSLTLTRRVDSDSTQFRSLFQAVSAGKFEAVLGTALLTFSDEQSASQQGGQFLQYEFSRAFVSGIATSGNRHGGATPEEQIQITFDAMRLTQVK